MSAASTNTTSKVRSQDRGREARPPYTSNRGGRGGGGDLRGGSVGGGIFQETVPAQLPARLSDQSSKQLVAKFKDIKASPDKPTRPGYGTAGNPITIRANFFPVKVPQSPIYDYVVQITPSTNMNRIKTRLFDLLEDSPLVQPYLPFLAHGRSQRLVSVAELPQPLDIEIKFIEENETKPAPGANTYTLSISFERELDTCQLTRYVPTIC